MKYFQETMTRLERSIISIIVSCIIQQTCRDTSHWHMRTARLITLTHIIHSYVFTTLSQQRLLWTSIKRIQQH